MINNMTTKEIKRLEKLANESTQHAKKAIAKSNEMHALLSLLEYKLGRKKTITSVDALFRRLKI